ncbi:MAG: hypothetical protein ACLR0U_18285 [Enterocloster clostridioformis]
MICCTGIQTGTHRKGSLSCTEILTALYHELMDVDPMNPERRTGTI